MWKKWRAASAWIHASDPSSCAPAVGYGGSCFPKDVAAFRHVAEQVGVDFGSAERSGEASTRSRRQRFFQKIRSALWTFRGKKIGVLGLAFKGGTDDIRESPALDIVKKLLERRLHDRAPTIQRQQSRCKEVIPPDRACATSTILTQRRRMRMRC